MNRYNSLLLKIVLAIVLAACQTAAPAETDTTVTVSLAVDGETYTLTTETLLVRDLLAEAGVTLNPLDQVTPSEFTPLSEGLTITIVRVTEELEIEERTVPFEKQTVRNEGLPEGEQRLMQNGVPGLEEVTYRVVYEDGVQVSRSIVRSTIITAPLPEIVMVGAQLAFTVIPIEGQLAYLSAGNAWMMVESSGNRRPLTISGDLDGRVFSLSPDGDYLLFTRSTLPANLPPGAVPNSFNHLWAISTLNLNARPVDLAVQNVLWADWFPGAARTLAYTTGEPVGIAPGWQARNELVVLNFDGDGFIVSAREVIPPVEDDLTYSYGTHFQWAPNGMLAYSRADTIGLVNLGEGTLAPLLSFAPYNTASDWVWNPGVAFSPDSRVLYTVMHGAPVGLETAEDSPAFDLTAVALDGAFVAALVPMAGIWSVPSPDPASRYLAYLQAIEPLNSVNSRYRLALIDRDGSNARMVFPAAGEVGLSAQTPAWSPDGGRLAVIWQGNLWVVDVGSGVAQQLTGDGQSASPQWRP